MTLHSLLAAARARPLPASPPTFFAPLAWPSVHYARRRMRIALNEACCAALCANLRRVAAQLRAEAETPPLGFRVPARAGKEV